LDSSSVVRTYRLPRRIWRILYPALIFVGLQFFFTIVVALTAGLSIAFREVFSGNQVFDDTALLDELLRFTMENVMSIVLASNIAGLAIFIPMWLRTKKRLSIYKSRAPVFTAFVVAGFFAGFNIIQMFLFSITDVMKYFPSYDEITEALSGGSFLMQVFTVGIIGPAVEELVFRGIVFGRMDWLPVWVSVLIQAALFGIAHMNLFQGLYAFIAGLLLALVFVKYRSMILVIIGHVAFNMVSVILGEFLNEDQEQAVIAIIAAGAVALVVSTIILIVRPAATSRDDRIGYRA